MALDDFGGGNFLGNQFNQAPAPTGTKVWLFAGVPLDGTQKNQLWFETRESQESYFFNNPDLLPITITDFSYQRTQSVLRVGANAEKLYNYNYIAFRNEQYGNKFFFGFIDDVVYKNENTTYVQYSLDVFQTYLFDVKFMGSYVKQMHQKEYRPAEDGLLVPYQRNISEEMQYGTEYDIIKQLQICGEVNPYVKWAIIVATDALEGGDTGLLGSSLNGVGTPLHVYLTPVNTEYGATKTVTIDGIKIADLTWLTSSLKNSKDLVNKVVSITLSDWCPVNITGTYPNYTINEATTKPVKIKDLSVDDNTGLIRVSGSSNYRLYDIDLGNVYQFFPASDYAKLKVSPYSIIELTDFKGHTQVIKPEYIHSSHLKVRVSTALSWTPKVSYSIVDYNISEGASDVFEMYQSDYHIPFSQQNWNTTIYDATSGSIPIASSATAQMLQSSVNSMRTAVTNFDATAETAKANTWLNAGGNVAKAEGSGLASGGLVGGVMGGAEALGNGMLGALSQENTLKTSRANLIRSQNAKLNDISNMPSNLNGMGNNTIFESNNNINGCFLVFKQIKEEYRIKLADYFKMFGYKANRLVDLSVNANAFHSRRAWNYVETENIQIVGHINSKVMQALKDIFDNGVTLWHTDTAKILVGDYSQTNEEL